MTKDYIIATDVRDGETLAFPKATTLVVINDQVLSNTMRRKRNELSSFLALGEALLGMEGEDSKTAGIHEQAREQAKASLAGLDTELKQIAAAEIMLVFSGSRYPVRGVRDATWEDVMTACDFFRKEARDKKEAACD